MAITINWPTGVINVPKADLTLVQASPTEIRELNLNDFRLTLKSLEDDAAGMGFTKTHNHNTEVTVSGITLARVVEILDPYTITFEDGQYAVNLVGANSNVGDRVNVNQVSVRSFNSAGLLSSPAIEYSSFNNTVLIDQVSGTAGTSYPIGTIQSPSSNTSDAKLIASYRGIRNIKFLGNGLLTTGDDFTGFTVEGLNPTLSTITVDSNAVMNNAEYINARITGTLDGGSTIRGCEIVNLNYINGDIYDSVLNSGTVVLGGNSEAHFQNCSSGVPGLSTPVIDCGGSGQTLAMRNYNGGVKLINKTGADAFSIDLNSGQVILDSSTVTSGTIVVRGVGKLIDENGAVIPSGVWNGGATIVNETVSYILSTTGGSLTVEQATQLKKVWQALMLDPANPVTTTTTGITFDDVVIDLVGDPEVSITGTRQP